MVKIALIFELIEYRKGFFYASCEKKAVYSQKLF